MKRIATILIMATIGSGAPLCAMPSQITFQGTLKQQGVPVNTTKNLQFSFVDATGATIPGTTPISIANVQVTNGLFAVQLPIDPAIPWEQYLPFIRVSVEGQTLTPDQPLNANLYAVAAIPQGMIAMFASTCPVGWTEFTGLRGRFPVGVDPNNSQFSVGQPGGNSAGLTNSRVTNNGSGDYGAGDCMQDIGTGSLYSIRLATISPFPYLPVIFCQKL